MWSKRENNLLVYIFLAAWMVTVLWRIAEVVQVMESPTSAGCPVMMTVAMKDVAAAVNAALQSKREVPAKLFRARLTGHRILLHPIRKRAVTRTRRCWENCKTNAVQKEPLSILGPRNTRPVETCIASLSLVGVAWSRKRPRRPSSSVTATTFVELDRLTMAVKLKDSKAD